MSQSLLHPAPCKLHIPVPCTPAKVCTAIGYAALVCTACLRRRIEELGFDASLLFELLPFGAHMCRPAQQQTMLQSYVQHA